MAAKKKTAKRAKVLTAREASKRSMGTDGAKKPRKVKKGARGKKGASVKSQIALAFKLGRALGKIEGSNGIA